MLSSGAFNALLKTLEEPPSYVIFILATTEKHKIPVTILSRCQKYDFKRISIDTIAGHLSALMEKEQIPAEEKALRYIARVADGSMRDALSLLDQCISFYLNQTLTYDNVLSVLGTVDTAVFSQLLRSILQQDTGAVLDIVDQMIEEGRELSQFLSDFLWYLRNLLILKDQTGAEDSLDMSSENIALLKEESTLIDTDTLLRFIRVLSDLSNQIRTATQKRILLEVGFIRLCTPQMETDTGSLLERLHILEQKLEEGTLVSNQLLAQNAASGNFPGNVPAASEAAAPADTMQDPLTSLEERFTPAEVEDLKTIAANWSKIVAATGMPMQQFLRSAKPAVSEDSSVIRLLFAHDDLSRNYFEQNHQQNLSVLSDLVAEQTGKRVKFESSVITETRTAQTNFIDLSKIHQKIIYE